MGSSVIVRDEGTLDRRADLPVVPDAGVEGEQPLHDAGPQARTPAAVAFEAELVLQRPDDRLDALAQPVREVPGVFSSFAGWRISISSRSGPAKNASVSAGQALIGDYRGARRRPVAGGRLSICRACSRSPYSLGLARQNPVTVPSQVQMSSSLAPQYQREWLGQ